MTAQDDTTRVFTVVNATCPYCGFIFHCRVELYHHTGDHGDMIVSNLYTPEVTSCPADEGGCDRWFALRIKLNPVIETFEMIEATK